MSKQLLLLLLAVIAIHSQQQNIRTNTQQGSEKVLPPPLYIPH
jgi:hypothetical protein